MVAGLNPTPGAKIFTARLRHSFERSLFDQGGLAYFYQRFAFPDRYPFFPYCSNTAAHAGLKLAF